MVMKKIDNDTDVLKMVFGFAGLLIAIPFAILAMSLKDFRFAIVTIIFTPMALVLLILAGRATYYYRKCLSSGVDSTGVILDKTRVLRRKSFSSDYYVKIEYTDEQGIKHLAYDTVRKYDYDRFSVKDTIKVKCYKGHVTIV